MGQSFMDRVKPWECGTCGAKNISANKAECPKCHTPRAGTAAALAIEATGQTVRTYEGQAALTKGIAEMAARGWRVVNQTSHQPSAGVGRTLALGVVGAAIFKPAAKFTVIFERA